MPENFAISQKILEKLEKNRPFKFKYGHSRLKDISPGDVEDIISIYLELKKQEEQAETKTPSDSAMELELMELTDEEKQALETMDKMIEELKANKDRYLRLILAYEKKFIKDRKREKEGNCCQPEDMKPYKGQKGSVSKATNFCRVCGQHWIFEKSTKPGEQEWFSATPAAPAKEKL